MGAPQVFGFLIRLCTENVLRGRVPCQMLSEVSTPPNEARLSKTTLWVFVDPREQSEYGGIHSDEVTEDGPFIGHLVFGL